MIDRVSEVMEQEVASPPRRRSWWLRWLMRLLKTFLFVLLVVGILYWQRVPLVNWFLARSGLPGTASVQEIVVESPRKIILRGLTLAPPEGNSEQKAVTIKEVIWEGNLDDLKEGRMGRLEIHAPEADIDPEQWQNLLAPTVDGKPTLEIQAQQVGESLENAPQSGAPTTYYWEKISISEAKWRIGKKDQEPSLFVRADIEALDVTMGDGQFSTGPAKADFSGIRLHGLLGPVAKAGTLEAEVESLSFGPDEQKIVGGRLHLEEAEITVSRENVASLATLIPPSKEPEQEPDPKPPVQDFRIESLSWAKTKAAVSLSIPGVPISLVSMETEAELADLRFAGLDRWQTAHQQWHFTNIQIVDQLSGSNLSVASIKGNAISMDQDHVVWGQFLVNEPFLHIAARLDTRLAILFQRRPIGILAVPVDQSLPARLVRVPTITCQTFAVNQARITSEGVIAPAVGFGLPFGETSFTASAHDLAIRNNQFSSPSPATISFGPTSFTFLRREASLPGALDAAALLGAHPGAMAISSLIDSSPVLPLVSFEKLAITIVPDELNGDTRWLREITLASPAVMISSQALPDVGVPVGGSPTNLPLSGPEARPWYYGYMPHLISITNGIVGISGLHAALPPLSTTWELTTNNAPADPFHAQARSDADPFGPLAPYLQELHLSDIRAHTHSASHALSRIPLLGMTELRLSWMPDTVWKEKAFQKSHGSGLHLQIGNALFDRMAFTETAPPSMVPGAIWSLSTELFPPPTGLSPAPSILTNRSPSPFLSRLRTWRVKNFVLDHGTLTITDLLPGLPQGHQLPVISVPFSTTQNEVPFTHEGFVGNVELRPVEIRNLRIDSPYNPRLSVAKFPLIIVEFSLDGLLNKQINRIVLDKPLLYVGEHLFWYQDYYRKISGSQQATPASGGESPVAASIPQEDGWNIGLIETSNGSMIIAPKGLPWKSISWPFPFTFQAEMASGSVQFASEIPPGDYLFDDAKLHLLGVTGSISFNLPTPKDSNNLVKILKMKTIQYMKFQATDAWMSVTFDQQGITGQFGGNAYGGYVNGGFFIQLDEKYTWTAWVSGSGISTGPITKLLTPEYLFLDAQVDATVQATGNMAELFDSKGDLKVVKGGRMHVTRLDEILADLPEDWGELKTQAMRLGMEPLRDYRFKDGSITFQTNGREGKFRLLLQGPEGDRDMEMVVRDYLKRPLSWGQ